MTATTGSASAARATPRAFDRRLLDAVPEARRPVAAVVAVGVARGLVAIGQALAVSALLVAVVEGSPVAPPLLAVVALFVVRGAADGLDRWVGARAGLAVATGLRSRLVEASLAAPADRRGDPTEVQVLLDQAPTAIEPWTSRYLPALVQAVMLPPAAVVAMALLDWRIALIPVLTVPLLPVFAALIGAATGEEAERRWRAMETLAGHYLDVMRGLVTLVDYGRAVRQLGVIREVGDRLRRATVATLRRSFLSAAALEMLASLSVALVAVFVGIALAHGTMPLAVGLPLILLAPEAYWPIRRVGTEFHAAADGAAAIDRILRALDRDPRPDGGDRTATAEVRLRELAVGHREPLVAGLDASLPVGLTAVTGRSGVGKSTLLEVLAGVRTPVAGRVEAPPARLVGQRPLLVSADLRTNLLLGTASDDVVPDDDRLRRALAAVGLGDWLDTLPDGLDTRLGDDGTGISAGQRVRVTLARLLVSDAPLLLLDEPTAHLDAEARTLVRAVIVDLAVSHVVVVATHDRAVVAEADRVLDLDRLTVASPTVDGRVGTQPKAEAATDPPVGREHSAPVRNSPPVSPTTAAGPSRPGVPPPGVAVAPLAPRDVTTRRLSTPVWTAGALGGLARACGVALTATSGWLIVAASFRPAILTLLVAVVLVRAFGIARPVLRWAERVRSHDHALATLASHRTRLWATLVPLSPARLGAHGRGRLLAGLVDDLDEVVQAQVRVAVPTIAMAMAAAVAVGVAALVLPAAAPIVAFGVCVAAAVGIVVRRRERANQDRLLAARADLTALAVLVAERATDLAGMGATGHVRRVLHSGHHRLDRAVRAQARTRAVSTAMAPLLAVVVVAAIVPVLGAAIDAGLARPLAALVLLLPLGLAEAVGGEVGDVAGAAARASRAGSSLAGLLAEPPAVSEPDHPRPLPDGRTMRRLDGVETTWNRHREVVALPDVALAPGDRVGVVGANGSGKSTLIAVLARHLDPTRGTHRIGQVDATAASLADVRARLAIVDDDPHVFASSLRENLRFVRSGVTDSDCDVALRQAGLGPWQDALPDGLGTRLGAGGRALSGGERTRLALARALLSAREVLVLDEPVAHLDHPTAVAVMSDVLSLGSGRTLLVAMHRPEGLGRLDHVLSLDRAVDGAVARSTRPARRRSDSIAARRSVPDATVGPSTASNR